jgi:hypothetical protein
MRPATRLLFALLVAAAGPPLSAALPRTPLTPAEAERAVELLAPSACRKCPDRDSMMAAAIAYNGGEIPVVARRLTLRELGGRALLPVPGKVDLDSPRRAVEAKALLGPDGRVVFVELLAPFYDTTVIGRATLAVFDPKKLTRVVPHRVAGRPVFAWVDLPVLSWRTKP